MNQTSSRLIAIEQLKRYDAQEIADYYRYRPWLFIGRAISIFYYAVTFALQLLWDYWFDKKERNNAKEQIVYGEF